MLPTNALSSLTIAMRQQSALNRLPGTPPMEHWRLGKKVECTKHVLFGLSAALKQLSARSWLSPALLVMVAQASSF